MRPPTYFHPAESSGGRRGFSMVELIIALTLGVIVLGAAMGYLMREMRTLAGSELRQSLSRNGRYIGVSLRHAIQRAGIEIESTTEFGTVTTWPGEYGDTLVILYVPYRDRPAVAHPLVPPPGIDPLLPEGGTCGQRCVEVLKSPATRPQLEARDLARLQVSTSRRLILIQDVAEASDTTLRVTFSEAALILRQPAGLTGGLRLTRSGTFVQELTPIIYYLDGEQQLRRAVRLNADGSPDGDILAYGVERFDVKLMFADGDVLEVADPYDEDDSNDFDDIVAVAVAATLAAERADPRVNRGELLRRDYEWMISPRNLRYERNR